MKSNKSLWIKAQGENWTEIKPFITTSLESGADYILLNESEVAKARELGNIKIAAFYGKGESTADVYVINQNEAHLLEKLKSQGKKTACCIEITSKQNERFAIEIGKHLDYLIISAQDWKVIPLENIIAELHDKGVEIIASITNVEEAKLKLEVLEHGADGILLAPKKLEDIKKAAKIIQEQITLKITLTPARVTKIKPVGMGDRVCIDTCSLLSKGEGMLIGSQSSGLFLVQGEVEESPYVAARPFRVNAGPVHAYVKVGEKTKYLSELEAGDEVLAVNYRGETRKVIVGRTKIERRPLILIEVEVESERYKTILQNAETIKLLRSDGEAVSVAALKIGDEVLIGREEKAKGRHFGVKIEETIIEK
jgi:3-dehydroquinate synthase II